MKNKIFLPGLACTVLAGCRVNRVTTIYESVTFAPKPENDSLWLFTPVLQFVNFHGMMSLPSSDIPNAEVHDVHFL